MKSGPLSRHCVRHPADGTLVVARSMVLARLEKLNFNVLDAALSRGLSGVNPLSFQLKLLWASLRGRVAV